ncbi:hypothetical protein C2S52_001203 [Perilla frutescens var. hirtella]|nr:hypothetical protein C2S51_007283 [Perilla frutescens var. frutescens]KAH6800739.1 hypothetical protein C2S52_001203 [Perilla frutescens var. hirtella]
MEGVSKMIQVEIAKHMTSYFKKGLRTEADMSTTHMAEVDHGSSSMDLTGHYAFGISTCIKKDEYIIDSGASNHMCCNLSLLNGLKHLKQPLQIFLPDDSHLWAFVTGRAKLNESIELDNVLYAPDFTHNLLSVGQLAKKIYGNIFLSSHCIIEKKQHGQVLGICNMKGSIYIFPQIAHQTLLVGSTHNSLTLQDLHVLLGHPSIHTMRHLYGSHKRARDDNYIELESCRVCHEAK